MRKRHKARDPNYDALPLSDASLLTLVSCPALVLVMVSLRLGVMKDAKQQPTVSDRRFLRVDDQQSLWTLWYAIYDI
jgi:hypothetical protein